MHPLEVLVPALEAARAQLRIQVRCGSVFGVYSQLTIVSCRLQSTRRWCEQWHLVALFCMVLRAVAQQVWLFGSDRN